MDLNWKKLKESKYKAGFRKMICRSYKFPNGKTGDYDIVDLGKGVCVLALTPENKVITVKIFRPGPEKVISELPGGLLESGLTPEESIKKELLEETGYTGEFKLVGNSYTEAYSTSHRYHFVATQCIKIQEPMPELDEEAMEISLKTVDEFITQLKSGELTNPETGFYGLMELGYLNINIQK